MPAKLGRQQKKITQKLISQKRPTEKCRHHMDRPYRKSWNAMVCRSWKILSQTGGYGWVGYIFHLPNLMSPIIGWVTGDWVDVSWLGRCILRRPHHLITKSQWTGCRHLEESQIKKTTDNLLVYLQTDMEAIGIPWDKLALTATDRIQWTALTSQCAQLSERN